MINLIRSSSKILILESFTIDILTSFIENQFNILDSGNYSENFFNKIFKESSEGNVLIVTTKKMKPLLEKKDIHSLILINNSIEDIMSKLINNKDKTSLNSVRFSPRIIVMKVFADIEKIIELVKNDVGGEIINTKSSVSDKSNGTLVFFTEQTVDRPIGLSEFYPKSIYVNKEYFTVFKYLRTQNLKYLNAGLHNEDWYELKIKIYDSYGHYKLHYKRMVYIMKKLELGMILGEAWGTDVANPFYTVGIYKVRFFTFLDPKKIKEVLFGLEYLDDGTRIVDYDLFYKRKKIHWDSIRIPNMKNKIEVSNIYRKGILEKLSITDKEELFSMEKEILESKKFKADKDKAMD